MFYHFQIFKEDIGYWSSCIELKGCVTQGDSIEELQENMEETLDLYLDELETLDLPLPLPDSDFYERKDIFKVPVNVKKARLEKGFTQN